jgi:hypothetical protein
LISAFFGIAGRSDQAHTALLLAHAQAAASHGVTLVRVTMPGETKLPTKKTLPSAIKLIEVMATSAPGASQIVHDELWAALNAKHEVILDLPGCCLSDDTIRSRIDVPIVTVGRTPLEETAVANALSQSGFVTTMERMELTDQEAGPSVQPPWLLGCARPGGLPAASNFERTMTLIASQSRTPKQRCLPITLPALTRGESASLLTPEMTYSASRLGASLLSVVSVCASQPQARVLDPDKIELKGGLFSLSNDTRELGDKLHELADALQLIQESGGPSKVELDACP